MATPQPYRFGNEDLKKLAEETVKDLLENFAYKEARRCNKKVGDAANAWWTSHYVKSFFFALAAKGLDEGDLTKSKPTLRALALVVGRAAANFADHAGQDEISPEHASRASQIVDCPVLSEEESRDQQRVSGTRAEWCN
jgi:hypothetical protein